MNSDNVPSSSPPLEKGWRLRSVGYNYTMSIGPGDVKHDESGTLGEVRATKREALADLKRAKVLKPYYRHDVIQWPEETPVRRTSSR